MQPDCNCSVHRINDTSLGSVCSYLTKQDRKMFYNKVFFSIQKDYQLKIISYTHVV